MVVDHRLWQRSAWDQCAMDWTAGYVTEIEYLWNYSRVLCPSVLRLVCLSAGVAPLARRPVRYLELGYGLGLSLNIHAAACAGEFWGPILTRATWHTRARLARQL